MKDEFGIYRALLLRTRGGLEGVTSSQIGGILSIVEKYWLQSRLPLVPTLSKTVALVALVMLPPLPALEAFQAGEAVPGKAWSFLVAGIHLVGDGFDYVCKLFRFAHPAEAIWAWRLGLGCLEIRRVGDLVVWWLACSLVRWLARVPTVPTIYMCPFPAPNGPSMCALLSQNEPTMCLLPCLPACLHGVGEGQKHAPLHGELR